MTPEIEKTTLPARRHHTRSVVADMLADRRKLRGDTQVDDVSQSESDTVPPGIFAFTPNDPKYPPYINISDLAGKLVVCMRGSMRLGGGVVEDKELLCTTHDGKTVLRWDAPGHHAEVALPEEQAFLLMRALVKRFQLAHPFTVTVNGQPEILFSPFVSYESIAVAADIIPSRRPIVKYQDKDGATGGTLEPEQVVRLSEGMIFRVAVTDGA